MVARSVAPPRTRREAQPHPTACEAPRASGLQSVGQQKLDTTLLDATKAIHDRRPLARSAHQIPNSMKKNCNDNYTNIAYGNKPNPEATESRTQWDGGQKVTEIASGSDPNDAGLK